MVPSPPALATNTPQDVASGAAVAPAQEALQQNDTPSSIAASDAASQESMPAAMAPKPGMQQVQLPTNNTGDTMQEEAFQVSEMEQLRGPIVGQCPMCYVCLQCNQWLLAAHTTDVKNTCCMGQMPIRLMSATPAAWARSSYCCPCASA